MTKNPSALSMPAHKRSRFRRQLPLYIMLLPGLAFFAVYKYLPMYGIVMAFQNFRLARGFFRSPWIGFENFQKLFTSAFFPMVMENTIRISLYKILLGFPVPILLALMLNEVRNMRYRRVVQTVMYMPHFVSWVIVANIISVFLNPATGVLPLLLSPLGIKADWLVNPSAFRGILVLTDIWKGAGWGTIIYIAALTGINPEMYEAATIDGAGRLRQIISITLPTIYPTVLTMFILRIGGLMDAGFEQVLMMQNDMVYQVSEIIGTYSYRRAFINGEYGFGAAVGLFQSVIGMIMVLIVNWLSRKSGEGRLW